MKRILLIMVMLLTVVGAKAQVTMNARVGFGGITDGTGIVGIFQMNIPFKKGSRFTFSPSVEYNHAFDVDTKFEDYYEGSRMLLFPLHIGCKASLGKKVIFFPKIGVGLGNDFGFDSGFICGPSTELSLETKHFVVALGAFYSGATPSIKVPWGWNSWMGGWQYSDVPYNPWKATISLGYKF